MLPVTIQYNHHIRVKPPHILQPRPYYTTNSPTPIKRNHAGASLPCKPGGVILRKIIHNDDLVNIPHSTRYNLFDSAFLVEGWNQGNHPPPISTQNFHPRQTISDGQSTSFDVNTAS